MIGKGDVDEKFKNIKSLFEKMKGMIDNASFNLLDDGNIRKTFLEQYQQIELRINLQLTVCAIFDTRNKKTRLIDGLMRGRISETLSSDFGYVILGDEVKQKQVLDKIDPKIKVKANLRNAKKYFKNSSIFLSPEKYLDFFIQTTTTGCVQPDVIILVMKSPKDLEDDYIQEFLSIAGKSYNDGNFFIVFNEADEMDCIAREFCDDCYPKHILRFLEGTEIKLEDRLFKISTSINCTAEDFDFIQADAYSNTFLDLWETLMEELSFDLVMDRCNHGAIKILDSMNEIQKAFDENKMKENIQEYDSTLQEKSEVMIEKIDNFQEQNVEKIMKADHDSNEKTLQHFYKMFSEFQQYFAKELINITSKLNNQNTQLVDDNYNANVLANVKRGSVDSNMFQKMKVENKKPKKNRQFSFPELKEPKTRLSITTTPEPGVLDDMDNEKVARMANEILLQNYLNKQEFEENIKLFVNKNFTNVDFREVQQEKLNKKLDKAFEKFKQAIKKTATELFTKAKNAFRAFLKSFKTKAVKKVTKIKKKVDKGVEECKKIAIPVEVEHHSKKIKSILDKKIESTKGKIESNISVALLIVNNLENRNIYPRFLGFYMIETIDGMKIGINIKDIQDQINIYLNTISKGTNEKVAEVFKKKLRNVKEIEKYADVSNQNVISFLGSINDAKYYRRTNGSIDVNAESNSGDRRFINSSLIKEQIQGLRTSLINNVDQVNQKLSSIINDIPKNFK